MAGRGCPNGGTPSLLFGQLYMTHRTWELRIDAAADGARNMQVDHDLLQAAEAASEPRTIIRFYSWTHPTLSLGRNQREDKAADLGFCRERGIEVVHRPTGGLAVLHDDEITYAVVSNEPDAFDGGSVYGVYRRVSEALAGGYRRLGVDVTLAPTTSQRNRAGKMEEPCFVSQSRYELAVGGRKLVGSAQRRLRRAFLQHGSMPLSIDRNLLARATRFGESALLESEMTALGECLDPVPGRDHLVGAFVASFERHFNVGLGPMAPGELFR